MSLGVTSSRAKRESIEPTVRLGINGRFLGQQTSGVQRYGREAIIALDRLLLDTRALAPGDAIIYVPRSVPAEALPEPLGAFTVRQVGRLSGHAWEQLELPYFAAGRILISLTNSAPIASSRQVIAVHDAAHRVYPADFRWQYRAWYDLLYLLLNRRHKQFITVSQFSAREIERYYRIRREAITVVPNAADQLERIDVSKAGFDGLGLKPKGYVLVVGAHSPRKNLELVWRGLERLPRDRPELVVVGGGGDRAFSLGATPALEGCRFLGQVSDALLKSLYRNALCLVFPSRYEGFGLPPLEAMVCGCPVIASRAASLPEVCGDAALYCEVDDPETVARGITALMFEPGMRDRLIAKGFVRAKSFSWRWSATRLLAAATQLARPPAMQPTVLR